MAGAQDRFEVSGARLVSEAGLAVRVDLRNLGSVKASSLRVTGELGGQRAEGSLESLEPGARGSVILRLSAPARAGSHVLVVLVEFREAAEGPPLCERAFLPLAIERDAPPALRLFLGDTRLDTEGLVHVGIESVDGEPHQVRLRLLPAHGVNVEDAPALVAVPERGRVSVDVRVLRAGAARGTRQEIVVEATPLDGDVERATAIRGLLIVLPDAAWLPRARPLLVALGLLLIAAGALLEARARARA